jgi:hypothetical protein
VGAVERQRIVDGWAGSDHPDLRGASKALQRSHEAREQGDAGRVADEWASAVTLGGSGCGAIGRPVEYLAVPTEEPVPLLPPAEPLPTLTEALTLPVGTRVGLVTANEPSTTLAVDVMWTRCVLRVREIMDTDYDGTFEDAVPSKGNRICVTKFAVENTGLHPAEYYGTSIQLVTSAGTFDSSGVAADVAAFVQPIEGDDLNSALGVNPRQTSFTFCAWEVPDDLTVQAVQFEDGQRVAVKVERLDIL